MSAHPQATDSTSAFLAARLASKGISVHRLTASLRGCTRSELSYAELRLALAERGLSYRLILARFYPGTRLQRWPSGRLARNLSETPSVTSDRGEVR